MNAVERIAALISPEAARRLAAVRLSRFEARPVAVTNPTIDEARDVIVQRWGDDLCALCNAMTKGELAAIATQLGAAASGSSRSSSNQVRPGSSSNQVRAEDLRLAVWHAGAALERGDVEVSRALQPVPVILGGHLVIEAAPRGLFTLAECWPRAIPEEVAPSPPGEEPESLDELLAAADRAIGVRLGARGIDKGAWGTRAAQLLGVDDRQHSAGEPDWRGDVEIKTVAVTRDRTSGRWRIVDDPAIAMIGEPALAKLARTLWLARTDVGEGDATIVAWYLLDSDPEVARMVRRYLHARPKGPAGTTARGLYLHKRFFADAGFLAALNGPA